MPQVYPVPGLQQGKVSHGHTALAGVPRQDLAAHIGQARISMTLDTYSHVLLDEGRKGSAE
jgi:hypothetical protein